MELIDVVLSDNAAVWEGGGIEISNGFEITMTRVEFFANAATYGDGGGLHCHNSAPVFLDCVFQDNYAERFGGGVAFVSNSSPTFTWTSIINNIADATGGGLMLESDASATLQHCTIAGNYSDDPDGGGNIELAWDTYASLENCVVAFSVQGYGICGIDGGVAELMCSNVYGNAAGNYGCQTPDQTGNEGNISADPLFCNLAGGDVSLDANSPCLPENNDCAVLMGAVGEGCDATSIESSEPPPSPFFFVRNHPNPFNPSTEIVFGLPARVGVTLTIYGSTGRVVRRLVVEDQIPAGTHTVLWDGRDDKGEPVPSGVYFAHVKAGSHYQGRKLVLIK